LWSLQLDVNSGANKSAKDSRNCTPLLLTAMCGHVQACNTLIELGAPLKDQNDQGKGVIHIAAERNHFDLLQVREKIGICLSILLALNCILCWH